jgi:lipoate-protein ligase A
VLWRGRKLIGSAQLRREGVFLQHGSLLLERGQTSLAGLLRRGGMAALAGHLAAGTTSVAEALGRPLTPPAAARRFAPAFAQALGLTLQPDDLTPAEAVLAADLVQTRYTCADWTARR